MIKPEIVGVAVQVVPVTVKFPPKEVRLLPVTVNVPFTSKTAPGFVVPIPTLPLFKMVMAIVAPSVPPVNWWAIPVVVPVPV